MNKNLFVGATLAALVGFGATIHAAGESSLKEGSVHRASCRNHH